MIDVLNIMKNMIKISIIYLQKINRHFKEKTYSAPGSTGWYNPLARQFISIYKNLIPEKYIKKLKQKSPCGEDIIKNDMRPFNSLD